jgi:hypothetical protein
VVTGVLQDLTKVSLLDCVSLKSGEHGGPKERRNYAHLFPNFVVCGEQHLRPKDKVITHAEFLIDDAPTLFYDFDAFSTVLDTRLHIFLAVTDGKGNAHIDFFHEAANLLAALANVPPLPPKMHVVRAGRKTQSRLRRPALATAQ